MSVGHRSDGLREYKQTGSSRTYYLYSGGVPVCELNADGSVKATNTFGANGLVSRTDSSGSKYYTFDPKGNVTQVVDNSGNVVATLQYDAYGNAVTGSDTNPTPYGFGGQAGYYTDSETGLSLATYRYYDPNEGRWLTRDPIGYLGGMDLYAYCDGNPVGALDPLGLWTVTIPGLDGNPFLQFNSGEAGYAFKTSVAALGSAATGFLTFGLWSWDGGQWKNQPGFQGSKTSWDVAATAATAYYGLARAGFRAEVGSWANGPEKLHFHLGTGNGLGTHHLPYQAGNWLKNLKGVASRLWRTDPAGVIRPVGIATGTASGTTNIIRDSHTYPK